MSGAERAIRVGVLTVSDGVRAGEREDGSGAILESWVRESGYTISERDVVADEALDLVRVLSTWADGGTCDVILTTGGTGLAGRDVTPEATSAVIERTVPGIAEAIRAAGRASTPHASLGRGVAGVRGGTLIVNLPGSPAAVRDGLNVLTDIVEHSVELLRGMSRHD